MERGESPVVLVVDDDPDDQLLVMEAFQTAGLDCRLEFATGGREALARIRQALPGQSLVVLLDMNMPNMDGLAFLHARAQDAQARRTPVIALTTSWDEALVDHAHDLGVNAFLVKPMRFADLVDQVRTFHAFWLVAAELPGPGR
jgi:CheY-like chemotaxis protein